MEVKTKIGHLILTISFLWELNPAIAQLYCINITARAMLTTTQVKNFQNIGSTM